MYPVGRRTYNRLGTYIAATARPVVDHEWLAEPVRQPLTYQTADDVGRAARGKWHDQMDWPRRIGLRPRDPRQGRQSGSARGQQKLTAGKFHLPSRIDGWQPEAILASRRSEGVATVA